MVSEISSHISSRMLCKTMIIQSINSQVVLGQHRHTIPSIYLLHVRFIPQLVLLPLARRFTHTFYYWNIGESVFDAVYFNEEIHFSSFSVSVARDFLRRFYIFYYFLYLFRCLGFVSATERDCASAGNRTRARIIFRIINLTAPVVNLINGTELALRVHETIKNATEEEEEKVANEII